MKEKWLENALAGYQEDAGQLFSYADSTLRQSLRNLLVFAEWLATGNGKRVHRTSPSVLLLDCTREQIEEYVQGLSSRGLQATTINRQICSLKSFYAWAVHHKLLEASPMAGYRGLKVPKAAPRCLTFEDVQALLTYTGSPLRTSTVRGKQVHAIISIFYYMGLTREELLNIQFEHIHTVAEGEIYLYAFSKGNQQRLIPFPEPAYRAYSDYVRFRPECPCKYVFISLETLQPFSKWDPTNICTQLSRKVKLTKKLNPRLLRFTYATHLYVQGQPIEDIGALLGLECMKFTKLYFPIDAANLRRLVQKQGPGNMAKIVTLIPEGAMLKVNTARRDNFRLSRKYLALQVAKEIELKTDLTGQADDSAPPKPEVETLPDEPAAPATASNEDKAAAPPERGYRAQECFQFFGIEPGVVALFWRLDRIDAWMAPILGAACKEISERKEIKQVVFDFSVVEEISTAAIATLVRFRNLIVYLEKEMSLVAGARLREQLERGHVHRMIEIRESLAHVVASEIRFVEERRARRGKAGLSGIFEAILKDSLIGRVLFRARGGPETP